MGNSASVGHPSTVVIDETFGEEGHFNVHVKLYEGFEREEKIKLRAACMAWVSVWQSVEFKEWVLGFKFQDTTLSSEEIYAKLIGGFEAASVVHKETDIEIWVKHNPSGAALGTQFIHDGQMWKGTNYLGIYSPAKLAGHLAHEYCRSLGFLHVSSATQNSVPFAVGKKTKRIAEAAAFSRADSTSVKYFED